MMKMKLMQRIKPFIPTSWDVNKLIIAFIIGLAGFGFSYEWLQAILFINRERIIVTPDLRQQNFKMTANSPLFNSALFGAYIPKDLSELKIKESMLHFRLVGILYGETASDSQVIIADGAEEHYYFVGDSLPGGVVLKQINKDSVVILYQGALESLHLPQDSLHFEPLAEPLIQDN